MERVLPTQAADGNALLLAAERRATAAGRRLVLIEGTPLVRRTLRITGLELRSS